jgi:hypothetical protein
MPALARSIAPTPGALAITTGSGTYSFPWKQCSSALAQATWIERSRAELSPSGYGIHWPLLDEDLAIGPLLKSVDPRAA